MVIVRGREHSGSLGYTLIELLVVLAALGLLLGVAAPRYVQQLDRSREAALRANLAVMRTAIDRFHADRGSYPESLQDLVQQRYLQRLPVDPFVERSDSWVALPPQSGQPGQVADVRSGASGAGKDGRPYASW